MDDDNGEIILPPIAVDATQDVTDEATHEREEDIPEHLRIEAVQALFQIIQNITEYDFNFDLALERIHEVFNGMTFEFLNDENSAQFIEMLIHEKEMFDGDHLPYLQFVLQLALFLLNIKVGNFFTNLFMEHLYDLLTFNTMHFDSKCMLTYIGILHLLVNNKIEFEINCDLICDIISNGDNTHKMAISSLLLLNPRISSIEQLFNFLGDFLNQNLVDSVLPQQIIINFTKNYINYFRKIHKKAILYELLGQKLKQVLSIPALIEILFEFDDIENCEYYIHYILQYVPFMNAKQTHSTIKIIIQYIATLHPKLDISQFIYPITENKGMKFLVDLLLDYEFSKSIIIFFSIIISLDSGELTLDLVLHTELFDVILNILEIIKPNDYYLIYVIGIIHKVLVVCMNSQNFDVIKYSLQDLNNYILNLFEEIPSDLTRSCCSTVLTLVELLIERIKEV